MKNRLAGIVKTGDADFLEIVKHSAWAFFLIGIASLIQFFFDLVLARRFGAEGSGTFYLALSILTMLALLGRLGIGRAVVKFIPTLVKNNNWDEVLAVKKSSFKLSLLISVPLAVVVFILAPFIAADFFKQPQVTSLIRIFSFVIPVMSLLSIEVGLLQAIKSVRESILVERIGIYSFGIVSILLLGTFYGITGVVAGFSFGIILTALYGNIRFNKQVPAATKTTKPFAMKVIFLIALPLLFVDFSNQLTGQLNIMLLGRYISAEAVGVFAASLKVSMLIAMVLTSINAIATTKISEFHGDSDKKKLELVASKTAGLAVAAGLPIVIFFFAFPEFVLSIFGSEFTVGTTALRILVIGQLVNLMVGSVTQILAMTGHEKKLAFAIVSTALVLNTALSVLLIPSFGIVGGAIAVASSIAFKNILLLFMVKKYVGIWSLPTKALKVWIRKV